MTGPLSDKHYASAFAGTSLAAWPASRLIACADHDPRPSVASLSDVVSLTEAPERLL